MIFNTNIYITGKNIAYKTEGKDYTIWNIWVLFYC